MVHILERYTRFQSYVGRKHRVNDLFLPQSKKLVEFVVSSNDRVPVDQQSYIATSTTSLFSPPEKRQFSELPSDVIQLILSFGPFVKLSDIPYESVSEMFGRLYDGKIISLYSNVLLDDSVGRYCLFDSRMCWKQVFHVRIKKQFSMEMLVEFLDRIIARYPHIDLFVECEVIMTNKDHLIFDKLSRFSSQIRRLNLFECPSELIISRVLEPFHRLYEIMLGRTEIEDMDKFVSALKCKKLSLAWVTMTRHSLQTLLQKVNCSYLSLYVIDTDECHEASYLEGLQYNKSLKSFRLVQKQACLKAHHLHHIEQNSNIKHLSIDLETEVNVHKILNRVAKNENLQSVELTNYLNDLTKGVDLAPLVDGMPHLKTLSLSKPLFTAYIGDRSNPKHYLIVRPAKKYLETE